MAQSETFSDVILAADPTLAEAIELGLAVEQVGRYLLREALVEALKAPSLRRRWTSGERIAVTDLTSKLREMDDEEAAREGIPDYRETFGLGDGADPDEEAAERRFADEKIRL